MRFLLRFVAPLFLLWLLIPLSTHRKYTLFPAAEGFSVYAFSDSDTGGTSESLAFVTENDQLYYRYVLGEGAEYPYCGIGIQAANPEGISLGEYAQIRIRIASSKAAKLRSAFRFYVPGFSDTGNVDSYLYLLHEINVSEKLKTITLDLNQYLIPNWWYLNNHIDNNPVYRADFDHFFYFELINAELFPRGVENEIRLESVSFIRDISPFVIGLLFILCGYYLLLFILFFIKKKRKNDSRKRPVEHLSPENHEAVSAQKVFNYIHANYHIQDMSVKKVSAATGVSIYKIPLFIKNSKKLTFKQYLNKLRIEEACHLLSTTECRVTEIAFALGYNNTTHFNRVFKEIAGESPKKFRFKNNEL